MKTTANKIINIMASWVGKSRSAGTHKDIIDIYNSYKPRARGYKVTYQDSYCDATVSAAFIKANAIDMLGGPECGVEQHIKLFKNKGIWIENGSITPKAGDIIVFNWDKSSQPNNGYADHIGIVEYVANGIIHTIEGNTQGGKVARNTYRVGNGNIRGFAHPAYTTPIKSVSDVAKEVIYGKWGNGEDRKKKLEAAGYNYAAVQAQVNTLLSNSKKLTINAVAKEVIRGKWGVGETRKKKLEAAGYNYAAVQAEVNKLLG